MAWLNAKSLRRRIVTSFDPSSLNLIRYYDPEDLTAGAISSWSAHSAIGPTLTASASHEPTAVDSVLNGKRIARFSSASTQQIQDTGGTSLSGTSFTLAMVAKFTNGTSLQVPFHMGTDSLRISCQSNALYLVPDNSPNYCISPVAAITNNAWFRVIYRYDGTQASNATKLRCRRNGSDDTLSFSGSIPGSITSVAGANFGAYTGSLYFFDGDIAWFAISSDCESDTTVDDLDAWLVSRFAL
jgi:hypothetical protein